MFYGFFYIISVFFLIVNLISTISSDYQYEMHGRRMNSSTSAIRWATVAQMVGILVSLVIGMWFETIVYRAFRLMRDEITGKIHKRWFKSIFVFKLRCSLFNDFPHVEATSIQPTQTNPRIYCLNIYFSIKANRHSCFWRVHENSPAFQRPVFECLVVWICRSFIKKEKLFIMLSIMPCSFVPNIITDLERGV